MSDQAPRPRRGAVGMLLSAQDETRLTGKFSNCVVFSLRLIRVPVPIMTYKVNEVRRDEFIRATERCSDR